jgi:DNA-directed RNA polymerase subunit RPC12/RpoP
MAEIVFPCNCGMTLKVYGDDQVGQGIVCPSCGSTIIVPAVGVAREAPASVSMDEPSAAPATTASGKWFGLAYLAVICVLTLGLIKFVLMPALAVPVVVAQNDSPKTEVPKESPKETPTESDEAPRRLLKKRPTDVSKAPADEEGPAPMKRSIRRTPIASASPRSSPAGGRGRMPSRTEPAAPSADEKETPDEPEPPARPEPVVPFGALPAGPLGELAKELRDRVPPELEDGLRKGLAGLPLRPGAGLGPLGSMPSRTKRSVPPKSSPPPGGDDTETDDPAKTGPAKRERKTSKKSTAKKSPYEDIANKEVRQALEYAAKNTTDILATAAAESFLMIAEKASGGDPKVMAEIEKIRHKIARIRNEE